MCIQSMLAERLTDSCSVLLLINFSRSVRSLCVLLTALFDCGSVLIVVEWWWQVMRCEFEEMVVVLIL